jgi:UDP:flavonoid glycosyltransferase YjiC (YdhE family)
VKRVLFVAEAVSLAHVSRPYVLANALLAANRFEVHFASAKRYPIAFDSRVREWPVSSITPADFRRALEHGRPIYSAATLLRYVDEDLALLDAVKPDLVVGDFRLSLAVSAPRHGVRYAAIANAHWSPYATVRRLSFPEHSFSPLFRGPVGALAFNAVQSLLLRHHATPLNRVRRQFGLPALRSVREVYTWGDITLYADVPELVPTMDLPASHRYIGPIVWSPEIAAPDWWSELGSAADCVYVTLGSSGQVRALPAILQALAQLPVTVLCATADRRGFERSSPRVKWAEYLPGLQAARRSRFVVCNGGSATVYQALAMGRPVVGVASNLDQHLTMDAVVRVGAGIKVRAEQASAGAVREAAAALLSDDRFATAAGNVAQWFAAYPPQERFVSVLAELFGAD